MRNFTPRELSLRLSAILSAGVTLIVSIGLYAIESYHLILSIACFFLFGIFCYYIILWGITYYIERRLRLVYKTIHSIKLGLKKDINKVDVKEDIFSKIRNEVIEWDKYNRKEIERLTDQERFRREFLGNVSHELKTPIFSIQGYILTLLEGGLEDKQINRSFLLKAEKGINRMIEMIDDLDEIGKLETNKIELDIRQFDILQLSREVIESLEDKARKKGIKLSISSAQKVIMVEADPKRISQVMTNLIVNSINYGNENGETKLKFFDIDRNILIEVQDTGKGIAKEHLSRLFERFYRIDKGRSRSDGGSGLGLAIVKHILEAHDQSINVKSEEGKGSTFSFTLKKA